MIILLKIYLISVAYMMLYYYIIKRNEYSDKYKKSFFNIYTSQFWIRQTFIYIPVINTKAAICIYFLRMPIENEIFKQMFRKIYFRLEFFILIKHMQFMRIVKLFNIN